MTNSNASQVQRIHRRCGVRWRTVANFTIVLIVGAASGCGARPEPGVVVVGKVVQNGKPLQAEAGPGVGWVEVELVPINGGEAEFAWVEADGAFLFQGQENGIEPGRYKLAVYQRSQGPESDDLEGAFGRDRTTLEYEIDNARRGKKQDLGTIDLASAPRSD